MMTQIPKIAIAPTMAILISGCSSYSSPRPAFAYFPVSCSVPGSFAAAATGAQPALAVPPSLPPAAPPPPGIGTAVSPAAQSLGCLIAAPVSQADYGNGSYGGLGYRYYDPYYGRYGYGGFGSFGIGIGYGHGWSGHGGRGFGHGGGHGHRGH